MCIFAFVSIENAAQKISKFKHSRSFISPVLESPDWLRNSAAEFGRYVSNEADSSIRFFMISFKCCSCSQAKISHEQNIRSDRLQEHIENTK